MAIGLSNKAIADIRGSSISAVEQLVTGMFKILGVADNPALVPRVEAIRLFVEVNGLPRRDQR
jgi:DNA-binding CsgD family transcriptional regulator